MQKLYEYLTGLNPDVSVATILALLFTLEVIFSNGVTFAKKGVHLLNSALLQGAYFFTNFLLATLVVMCFKWIEDKQIGLFNIIVVPYYLKVIVGVFLVDLVNYWAHRLYHTMEIFWRLHRVHHSDTMLDSSTAYRFHPLDAILDNSAGVVAAILFGLDPPILILWFVLYIPVLVLHHSNFIMPSWFDKTIGKIIVSPNYHKVHHHEDQEYTDSNYGLLFIIWDKFFKSFKTLPVKQIKFGLREFDKPGRQTFWFLLLSPFLNLKKKLPATDNLHQEQTSLQKQEETLEAYNKL